MQSNYHGLKEEFLELKIRYMQENLIFFGIPEVNEQTEPFSSGQANIQENAEQTLRQFMSNQTKMHENAFSNIRLLTLNVCGLRAKTLFPEFTNLVNEHDIIGLQETRTDQIDDIDLKG